MSNKILNNLLAIFIAFCLFPNAHAQNGHKEVLVPYVDVIECAKIKTNSLQSTTLDALIQGNRDLYSICYVKEDKEQFERLGENVKFISPCQNYIKLN